MSHLYIDGILRYGTDPNPGPCDEDRERWDMHRRIAVSETEALPRAEPEPFALPFWDYTL